ncbi:MAG TPA: LUD domain-containing protein [bacterium]|nr:LUD domain-containing protein [bacterium]HPT30066.1 LUD domain-containing protein [bacterium]
MEINQKFATLASDDSIAKTIAALNQNGITTYVVNDKAAAKEKALSLLPAGAEVMNMSSITLAETGIDQEITSSEKYKAARNTFATLNSPEQQMEKQRLGAAPEYAIGSVHAVTENGEVLIASATGSQLPAYAFGSRAVIWVVGSQKIVENVEVGRQRLAEYCLPLENERALKAYGQGSSINKVLLINKEVQAGRITLIIVKEKLGF